MMVTSPAAPRLLTETRLPARSAGLVMPESPSETTAFTSRRLGLAAGVVADDDDAEVLQVGAERAERLADRELDVAAEECRDRLGPALGGHDLDLDAVVGEDPLVDRAPTARRSRRSGGPRRGPSASHRKRCLRSGRWMCSARRSRCTRQGSGRPRPRTRRRQVLSSLKSLSCGRWAWRQRDESRTSREAGAGTSMC